MDQPVAIVGGGIGGLTAAIALTQRGIECRVYERAPELNEIGAGLGLWPAALSVYDRLGVGDEVRALSYRWTTSGVRMSDGRFVVRYSAEEFDKRLGGLTIGVHRGELQSLLLGTLPAGVVHTGREFLGLDDEGDEVSVSFTDGSTIRTPLLIGADGRHSSVRTAIFGHQPLHDCQATGWRGTATMPPGAGWGDIAGETWGTEGRFGILPICGNRVTWYAAAKEFRSGGGRDELVERYGHWHDPIRQLIDATPDDQIWVDGIDDRRPTRQWSKGRVVLMGDAAHPMSPDLGQGACQAIMDAEVLADELAGDDGRLEEALRRYVRRRWRRAGMITMVARVATMGARSERRSSVEMRRRVSSLVPTGVLLRQLSWLTRGP